MAATAAVLQDAPAQADHTALDAYVDLLHAVERAQRQLHETVAAELERSGIDDVTAVQALLLFHLGDESLTAAEIMHSGRYLGSNVSYNLKKLNEGGRLESTRGDARGAPRFRATATGKAIQSKLWSLFGRQREALKPVCSMDESDVAAAASALKKLERYWFDQVRYKL
jgi:DNA-binding MarR family transcriptional regulator